MIHFNNVEQLNTPPRPPESCCESLLDAFLRPWASGQARGRCAPSLVSRGPGRLPGPRARSTLVLSQFGRRCLGSACRFSSYPLQPASLSSSWTCRSWSLFLARGHCGVAATPGETWEPDTRCCLLRIPFLLVLAAGCLPLSLDPWRLLRAEPTPCAREALVTDEKDGREGRTCLGLCPATHLVTYTVTIQATWPGWVRARLGLFF